MRTYRGIIGLLMIVLAAFLAKPVQAQSSRSHGHGHIPSGNGHHHGNPGGGSHFPPGHGSGGNGHGGGNGNGNGHGGGNGGGFPYCPQPVFFAWIPYPYWYYSQGVVTTPPIPPPGNPTLPLVTSAFPLPGQVAPVPPAMPRVVRNPVPAPRNHDTTRAKELTELGDRLFRAGNYVRAVERYEQAIRANPDRAEPRARLAQIALVRGKYQDAANKLREALTAEPGWLLTAGNLQAVFPEPAVFDGHVAKLEAHLQANPDDRDAWLVLGSLWYLSGRTQKASDVFLRLSDRREDPTLKAFLSATKSEREP